MNRSFATRWMAMLLAASLLTVPGMAETQSQQPASSASSAVHRNRRRSRRQRLGRRHPIKLPTALPDPTDQAQPDQDATRENHKREASRLRKTVRT